MSYQRADRRFGNDLGIDLGIGSGTGVPSIEGTWGTPGKRTLTESLDTPFDAPRASRAGGATLPGPVRASMERAFAMDLSAVRIHQGDEAAEQGALAYAQGADLHFAPGQYDPYSERGLALLGHELAHVAQHAEGRAPGPQAKGAGGDPSLEAEADALGARAARGEPARPAGSARLTAVRDPDGAIQRMIDQAAPPRNSDWPTIERYLFRTLINQRKQTFQQAVEEYVATAVTGSDIVDNAWQRIEGALNKDRQEATALGDIALIIRTINDHKRDVPDHPNKRGIGPGQERYETVPQSQDSKQISATVRGLLVTNLLGTYRPGTPKPTYYDPAASRRRVINGNWSDGFMLGVLVRPDGVVQVSHSGFMGPSQSNAFQHIVQTAGYTVVRHDNNVSYRNLQQNYHDDIDLTGVPDHQLITDNKRKEKVQNKPGWRRHPIEEGNPVGVCAAPQVLESGRPLGTDFPPELTGGTPMAMTEVWVNNSGSSVEVHDSGNNKQRYSGNQDVPSCLTCQHQLRAILKKLTDLRRNVVNREQVRSEESHDELVGTVEELRKVIGSRPLQDTLVGRILPNKPSVGQVRINADLGALDLAITAFSSSIDTQAKERTAHPEHIEHDDKSRVVALKPMVKAEEETNDHRNEALWAKRTEVGKLLQQGEDTRVIDAREPRALEAAQTAKSSSELRDELEALQVGEEAKVLERAERELTRLDHHVESGYLLPGEASQLRGVLSLQLSGYQQTTHSIRDAKTDDRETLYNLHYRLDLAMRLLRGALGELDHQLFVGHERVREERAREFERDALQSSDRRERTQRGELHEQDRDESMLREGAQTDANASSRRREQAESDRQSALLSLAMNLAQYYETSLETELERLVTEDTQLPTPSMPEDPTPRTDYSNDYIG